VYRAEGTVLAMHIRVVGKKTRELGVTLAVLAMLFGMLMVINPQVRERFSDMTASVQSGNVDSSIGPVSNAAYAVMSIGSDYAADNPLLFSFLVVAVILFMLMLRSL
jgi:hypothetical protein